VSSRGRYLIVGGGMTADAACKGIRGHDPDGSIVVVGAEPDPPYSRPPLTKGLWSGSDEASIWRGTDELGVELVLGRRVVALDLAARTATDDAGGTHEFDRLLLATGGRPRRLPFGGDDVVYFRTVADYRRTRALADRGARFVVIGGGFIGSELAAALASNGCEVAMAFPEDGIGGRLFPPELAAFVTDYYRSHGVEVHAGRTVTAIDGGSVALDDGTVLTADAVIAGLGIEPAVELAEAAGLEAGDGITVDDRGRVPGADDVFAAGDVARFPAAALGVSMRVEHEDHALTHGRTVGANMAGADTPYDHLPFFYSDLFDLGYEAVGEVTSSHATAEEWTEPNRTGVVAYLDEARRPRGFLLWNVWDRVDAARELIGAGEPLEPGALSALAG
jgi:3-phenylpropionate/trans-cinnamate dioxygenase ferredoxin reductase component